MVSLSESYKAWANPRLILGIKGLNSNFVTIIIFFQKNWIFIKAMTLTHLKDFYPRTKVEITGDETVLLNSEFFYV